MTGCQTCGRDAGDAFCDCAQEVVAVLLVPAEGDPHGLLREGPCGARPPTTMHPNYQAWDECDNWEESGPFRECPKGSPCSDLDDRERQKCIDIGACRGFNPQRALVLAWDGQPVAEGWMRLGLVLQGMDWGNAWLTPTDGWPLTMLDIHEVAACAERQEKLGAVILLDAEGREVKP